MIAANAVHEATSVGATVLPPGHPKTNIKYHQPARLDDELLVTASALEIRRAYLTISQQARLGPLPTGALLVEATIRIGWVMGATFKPARIPPNILEALQ